jgi:hypothetical protein
MSPISGATMPVICAANICIQHYTVTSSSVNHRQERSSLSRNKVTELELLSTIVALSFFVNLPVPGHHFVSLMDRSERWFSGATMDG